MPTLTGLPAGSDAIFANPVTLKVLNPRAEVQEFSPVSQSPRLHSLDGKKIGLINNAKLGANILHAQLEKVLLKIIPSVQLKTWTISHVAFENKEKGLQEVAKASDGVILFLGD
jgi:hypothetical protein